MPYVYRLTETTSKMWYIGCRCAKGCQPEELGVSYFTSSRVARAKSVGW
jgi:hypothetical protein